MGDLLFNQSDILTWYLLLLKFDFLILYTTVSTNMFHWRCVEMAGKLKYYAYQTYLFFGFDVVLYFNAQIKMERGCSQVHKIKTNCEW